MALQDVLECDSGLKPGGKSPFWVANDTGVVVSFWLAPSLQAAWKRPPGEHLTAHHCDPCRQQMQRAFMQRVHHRVVAKFARMTAIASGTASICADTWCVA